MAAHFYPLKIIDVKKETPDCVSVSFDIPDHLQQAFSFREGQNITIKKTFDGSEIRRSYSICSAPHERHLRVAVKKYSGGLFSNFANDHLKAGDVLNVMPPAGKFNARTNENQTGNHLAIAAGSGITPVISIIKHVLQSQPHSSFTLIYSNRNRNSIIFFEELEALKNRYMQRFNLVNILSREKTDQAIFYGRITQEKLAALGKLITYKNVDHFYLCGPEEMILTCNDFLQSTGIDKKNIHFELFTSPGKKTEQVSAETITATSQGPMSKVSIRLDGRSFDFDLTYKGLSILDAALLQGADLPYACKGGVCATCRAKLLEGQVYMDVNYALEPEEIEQGFILTCQSHPATEKVFVDFDIK